MLANLKRAIFMAGGINIKTKSGKFMITLLTDVANLIQGKMLLLSVIFACTFAFGQVSSLNLPSNDVNLINFNYYSYQNPTVAIPIVYNDATSLQASGIQSGKDTIFLIDGFLSNSTNSRMTAQLKTAIFGTGFQGNMIIVDWGALSGGTSGFLMNSLTTTAALSLYPLVVINAPEVGKRVGDFIQFLGNKGITGANVWILGHSEGAHIAGVAGSWTKSHYPSTAPINHITGLDPAGPLYIYDVPGDGILQPDKLTSDDATWVDVYHTGRGITVLGLSVLGLGTTGTDVGHIDVFVNGGNGQPGCSQSNPLLEAYCNHSYSWQFYVATITNAMIGCSCDIGIFNGSCFYNSGCALCTVLVSNPVNSCSPGNAVGYGAAFGSTAGALYVLDTTSYAA